MPAFAPPPIPARDLMIGQQKLNTDSNTGLSFPWLKWFNQLYASIIQTVSSIQGSTIIVSTQPGLGALAASLTTANTGQLVYVSDYNHELRWDGTGFTWGPGDNGSGYILPFFNDPSPTTGWQLCDGSATTKLNSDGSTSPVTVPNYGTPSYLKLATALVAGPTAASGVTGATSAGTPSGTNSNPATGNESADTTFNAAAVGTPTTVAAAPHTHTTTAPVFTGNALGTHTHTPGTLELERTQLKAWYRR